MSVPSIAIVGTGTANTASVLAAFTRLGAAPRLVDDPLVVRTAPYVVLPGVGSFAAAMRTLEDRGLRNPLRQRVEEGRPTLAICLGLQLLCATSEESPGTRGLGVVSEVVRAIPAAPGRVVPQLGWNRVEPHDGCALLERGWAYFAHSYRLERAPTGWSVARTEYGGAYVSAMELGPVLACQFHPELSGEWGAGLLRRWLDRGREATRRPLAKEVTP